MMAATGFTGLGESLQWNQGGTKGVMGNGMRRQRSAEGSASRQFASNAEISCALSALQTT
jgi:hypothetical protein